VSFGAAVKEKLPEELDPCFRGYKCINHWVRFGLMSNKFTRYFGLCKSNSINMILFYVGRRDQGSGIRDQAPEIRDHGSGI
jgi:hypothetical protein